MDDTKHPARFSLKHRNNSDSQLDQYEVNATQAKNTEKRGIQRSKSSLELGSEGSIAKMEKERRVQKAYERERMRRAVGRSSLTWLSGNSEWCMSERSTEDISSFAMHPNPSREPIFYNAEAKELSYMGRHIMYKCGVHDDVAPVCQLAFSGVSITVAFQGTAVYVRMNGGGNHFNVLVDGELHAVISTSESLETYLVARFLCKDATKPLPVRQLVLQKRTEACIKSAFDWFEVVNFYGFFVCGTLHLGRTRPARYCIEFVGDSDTSAFGCEGVHSKVDDVWYAISSMDPGLQNAGNSFATIVAKAFDAEPHLVCWSGIGAVDGPPTMGADATVVAKGMRAVYDRVLPNEDTSLTPKMSGCRPPDLICVLVGGCDVTDGSAYNENDSGSSAAAVGDLYLNLLLTIRAVHPKVAILCLVPDPYTVSAEKDRAGQARTSARLQECVQSAVQRAREHHEDSNIHVSLVCAGLSDPHLEDVVEDLEEQEEVLEGPCDWATMSHWSPVAHLKVAESVACAIEEVTKWERTEELNLIPHMNPEYTGVTQSMCTIL